VFKNYDFTASAQFHPDPGVAILLPDDGISLVQLSALLPEQDRDLITAILQQVESEAIHIQN
jgi:hypothetical protein